MRHLKFCWLLLLPLFLLGSAYAQEVQIVYPQEGQDVRGEITARFEGIPAGGYALVKVDGQFRQATAQDFIVLDTISDRVTFTRGDGIYKLEVTVLNAGGRRVGTDTVSFNVANSKVSEEGDAVRLVHWTTADRLGNVQRYRVFAESNATISGGDAGGGAGGGGAAGGGAGAAATESYIAAPLDWQVSALMRRVVRDTGLLSNSANISTIIQEAFQRQRLGTASTTGAAGATAAAPASTSRRKKKAAPSSPSKGPWNQDERGVAVWSPAPETGKYFIKMVQQNGNEINATRKAPSIAIADLLPTFPDVAVRPGSTWETTMSFVGDLSSRLPINVKAPITFTAYENLQTPSGESRRCAKLESRFRLPENLAKRIAANLANKSGTSAGAGGGAPAAPTPLGGGGQAEAATGILEEDIEVARTDVARILWFDIERRRILRAEDIIKSNFEIPLAAAEDATGAMGAEGPGAGAAAVAAEPQAVSYDLKVTTWMDDRVPNPTGQYLPGGAGAHSRDSVTEPGLARILNNSTTR